MLDFSILTERLPNLGTVLPDDSAATALTACLILK
jgi:hypothetical protein